MALKTLVDIGTLIEDDLQTVRDVIKKCVKDQPAEIRQSLDYHFSSGGKLLRPMLAFLTARAAAGGELNSDQTRELALFAAASEFVHNASLVHDDIMDGDLFRRNLRTLQALYGETCAVLIGDVLHITAFDLLSRLRDRSAIGMMTKTIRDMCYGQLLDVKKKNARPGSMRI